MDYKKISEKVLEILGGKQNILSNAVCMTRLRVELKDSSIVDVKELKNVDGVLGVKEGENLQIIFGPGKVNRIGEEFSKLINISLGQVEVEELAKTNKQKNKEKHNGVVQRFLQRIANIFVPLLPGIISAGLIMGLCNVVNVSTKGAFATSWWFLAIQSLGYCMFAYLSIFVGMNACREFGGSYILGGVLGGIFVASKGLPLMKEGVILPLTAKAYAPGMGGLIASLIMGIIAAKLEKNVRKIVPTILDTFFTPIITLIISVFIAVLIIQPLGTGITHAIFGLLDFIYTKLGFVGGYVLSAGFLPLVAVGLHQALTPIHVLLNNPDGPTHGINYLLPILMMAGGGQVGAGFAIYLKTKNKKLKNLTRDALPVGILGIGEPLMYAVTLPLGMPFITACLGSGFGGLLASIFHLGTISVGVSGLFGLLIVVPGTWIYFIISMLGAYIGGFVLTYLFGVNEERIEEIYGE